jgi:heparan-alpha-glucosaminide N-acetyltransferase
VPATRSASPAMVMASGLARAVAAPVGVVYPVARTMRRPRRWAGVDAARGVAVAGMLVVEQMPGGPKAHPWLVHATWNGWTGADLVFPCFLFLVGIGVDEMLRRRGARGLGRLCRRAIALVVIGILFNAWPADGRNFEFARWPGVLQRIGLVGLLCGIIVVLLRRRIWPIVAVTGGLLVLYAQLLTKVALVCGTGVVAQDCNVPGAVDAAVFGTAHIYHQGALGHDPEGLVSTIGALATALVGVAVVRALRAWPGWRGVGTVAGAATLMWAATHFHLAGPDVNKRLWTPAFVLLTGATSIFSLLVCHVVADMAGTRAMRGVRVAANAVAWPWVALGRNALIVYVGQHVLGAIVQSTPAHIAGQRTSVAGYLQNHVLAGGWFGLDSQWTYVTAMLVLWTAVAAAMHSVRWYVTL